MSINKDKLIKLNELVTKAFRRKHIIVVEQMDEQERKEKLSQNMICDKAEWKIPEEIKPFVEELSQNSQLSDEEKIISIYERLCQDYIYDDNLISYIQKIDDDSYSLPDWYGRDVNEKWVKNRQQHNRRVCYEVSRYLAQSLKELFKNNEDVDICIFWDKGLTHYFVGLSCSEYSLTLDLDDFNNIKDLTRLKSGLTIDGIKVLDDKNGKFQTVLNRFNQGRCKEAITNINNEIENKKQENVPTEENDDIAFLKYAIEILKDRNIDSQGIYEYIKEIVDIKLGPEARKKVWKEIKGKVNEDTRYIRCLLLNLENQKYIIDVDRMLVREFDIEELRQEDREFIPYKELLSEELINYRSRKEERYSGR